MHCTRCGAELSDSAQACPICGLPRQQMTSAPYVPSQQSQPLPVVPQVQAYESYGTPGTLPFVSSASPYLPTGVPVWPTAVAVPVQTMHPPVTSTPVHAALPTQLSTSERAKAERTRRVSFSARNVLVSLAFLILVPLIGAGITYGTAYLNGGVQAHEPEKSVNLSQTAGTPSTSTTDPLPTPNSFVAMSSASQKLIGILINYPADWQEDVNTPQSDGSIAIDFHPQQQLGIIMYVGRFPATSGTTSDINNAQLQAVSGISGVSSVQPVQPSSPQRRIGGSQWDEQDASFTTTDATTYQMVSVTVKHKTYFYNILFWSPNMYYNEAVQKYIQPMLSSFKFLS